MKRLQTQEGCFIHPTTYEPLRFIEVVIVDSGKLSRNYYKDDKLVCWSFDCDFPDNGVLEGNVQASRCMDCSKSIKAGQNKGGAACKYFTNIKVAFPETDFLYELRLGGLSLFSKEDSKMNLYKYIEHLERNREHVGNVLTQIYFVQHRSFYKMYFKPVRPLAEDELINIQQLNQVAETNPFKEQDMANPTHVIKDVVAQYPRIDKPYKWDDAQGRSVPCDAMEDGASYDLSFKMEEKQAKEIHRLMEKAWKEKCAADSSFPKNQKLKVKFKKQDDGTFIGKTSLKAAYSGNSTSIEQFDSKNKVLEPGFQLTTGSLVSIAVEFFPYKMNGGGVSLRLRGVQVKKYIPYKPASPFEVEEDGFTADEREGSSSPFTADDSDDGFESSTTSEPDPFDDEDEEPIKEPVKRKKKKDIVEEDDDDIEDIISSWGSDD